MTTQELENRIKDLELQLHNLTSGKVTEDLSEMEESLQIHIENSFDVIFTLDSEGTFVFISSAWERLFGFSSNDAIGRGFAQFVHPDDVAPLLTYMNGLFAVRQSATSPVYRVMHADGQWRWIVANCTPYFTPKGIPQIIGVARDITAQVNAEAIQRETDAKFKEIINQINDGIIVCDERANIIIWNNGAEQIFGLKACDAIGQNIADIQYLLAMPQFKDKERIRDTINRLITMQTPEAFNCIRDNQIVAVDSHQIRNIQSNVFPIKLDNSYLFCAVFRDTTELHQFQKQLVQLNSDKDRFISILAHDLKSPFNALLGFSELLLLNIREYTTEEIENFAAHINKTAVNTYNLLEDILLWAHSQSGKIPFNPEVLYLNDICNNIKEVLNANAAEKGISIGCDGCAKLVLFADSNMLKTILRNLVSNAIKFTNKGGHITVSAVTNCNDITITVADDGIGIQPDVIPTIFDITHKINRQGTANEHGTGLGLILCKEFVDKHNGQIWVESVVEKGSKFMFSIPISRLHDGQY